MMRAAIWGNSVLVPGAIKSSGTGGIGYSAGAGGTITQLTDKTTTVIINKTCGTIVTMNTILNAATIVSFTVTNSTVAATDLIAIMHDSGGTLGSYTVNAGTVAAGSFAVNIRNNTAGNLTEALTLRFAVIKGAVT